MGGKEEAPRGPDWNKLLSRMDEFIGQNQDLFKQAMSFNKKQFSKGEQFVDAISNYGMDAAGRLGRQAQQFQGLVDRQVAQLQDAATSYGQANSDIYRQQQEQVDDLLGTINPAIQDSAGMGGTLLDRYKEQGLPFQDEYINKLKGWDTTARREGRAAEAVNDLSLTTEAAREAELRRLESYGIDPSQTRSAALDSRIQAQNAVAKAQAANAARRAVEGAGLAAGQQAYNMYQQNLTDAQGLSEGAIRGAAVASQIGAQPGTQYLSGLGNLANYLQGVAQIGQAGGNTAFNMNQNAINTGLGAIGAAATQQNQMNNFGAGIYDQAGRFTQSSAGMLNSGYGTGAQLNANDLRAHESDQQNSFWGGVGNLVGMALPAALGSPWLGTAIGGMSGLGGGGGGGGSSAGVHPSTFARPVTFGFSEGGEVPRQASPSAGAIQDDVPAMLNANEYVLDSDTVRWHGVKSLRKLQEEAKKGYSQAIPV